jgi:lipoic acid synthetase
MDDRGELTSRDLHLQKPEWLKTPIARGQTFFAIRKDLREKKLYTVCEEAKCPNISQCWNYGTATFMILGDVCTRACRFCHIKTGDPEKKVDPDEPNHIAQLAKTLKLRYAVITMVDRDDLEDGGASHVAQVIQKVKEVNPGLVVEILTGDFRADEKSIATVLDASPQVFAHNIETVERLTPRVRDARAGYGQSLAVLKRVREMSERKVYTKSALMLGLGETLEEVIQSLRDLRMHGVDFVTIGQYMRPTKKHLSIKRWVSPEEFNEIGQEAQKMGFLSVASGPLVRSSYKASEFYSEAMKQINNTP